MKTQDRSRLVTASSGRLRKISQATNLRVCGNRGVGRIVLKSSEDRSGRRSAAASVSEHLGHGLALALSTLLFLLGGRHLDARWDTEPLLTLIGALVGAGAGFYSMYYHLVIEPKRRKERESESSDQ